MLSTRAPTYHYSKYTTTSSSLYKHSGSNNESKKRNELNYKQNPYLEIIRLWARVVCKSPIVSQPKTLCFSRLLKKCADKERSLMPPPYQLSINKWQMKYSFEWRRKRIKSVIVLHGLLNLETEQTQRRRQNLRNTQRRQNSESATSRTDAWRHNRLPRWCPYLNGATACRESAPASSAASARRVGRDPE